MLKKVRLKNFKLHEDTSIDASRINVFIGPNNSGKSSIFQALLALKHAGRASSDSLIAPHQREGTTQEQPFLYTEPRDPIVDLGEFSNVLRNPSGELQIGVEVELPPDPGAVGMAREMGAFHLDFDLWFRENRLVRHGGLLACAFGRTTPWAWGAGNSRSAQAARLTIPRYGGELFVNPGGGLSLPFHCGIQFQQPPLDVDFSATTNELNRLLNLWSRFLSSFRPVHQLRGFEEWGYPTTNFPAHERLDRLVLSDRAVALTNLLAANARLRTRISDMLKTLVGVGIEFETASAHRVKVWATASETGRPETLYVNEGSGANQLPFILVPVALAESGDTVILSEPEAHLHPKRQSELTGMLLKVFQFTKGELQFFIETHSEHVLHTILNTVAKGELSRDDVALFYFQNKGGVAVVEKKEINQFGQIEGGLPDFFEQSLTELTEYLKALSKT